MCETPKSPPGDYNNTTYEDTLSEITRLCETPKSPPGDYNRFTILISFHESIHGECETPKSPPGDYNLIQGEPKPDRQYGYYGV